MEWLTGSPTPISNIRPLKAHFIDKSKFSEDDLRYISSYEKIWMQEHSFWSWNNENYLKQLDEFKEENQINDETDPKMNMFYQKYLRNNRNVFIHHQKRWIKNVASTLLPAMKFHFRHIIK
jgi:hypothetical protein